MTTRADAWSPYRELDELQARMSQVLESLGDGAPRLGRWSPPVDIEETDDAFIVEAELPGVSREDVEVELRDNDLRIRGEVKERKRVGVLRRQTRRTGAFDYRVSLPVDVEADQVEASLDDGVLRLRVPKTREQGRRRIEITSR